MLGEVSLEKLEHVGGIVSRADRIEVIDAFFGWRLSLDPVRPGLRKKIEGDLPCPLPITANAAENGNVWYVDAWAPWIIKCDAVGRLLDWGERPFGGDDGVAFDGTNLWALDRANRRFSVLRKSGTAPHPAS